MRNWVEYANFGGDSTLARQRAANGSPEPFGVRYWGVGNENWGCGGSFCPEDYAAEYKRFATFLGDFGGPPLYLIACGPAGNDPDWTRRFFTKLGGYRRIHAFAAHYYCGTAGTATEYTTDEWYQLIERSLAMEPLIVQQRAIIDSFSPTANEQRRGDPRPKVDLIVDEWGTWHPPAPGHNPHHLWQQNTLRDALVAAASLDIFNRHADKVVMGNIAQTINVLQAMILTDGPRMVTTPTYHVYAMYQAHQGGHRVPTTFEADEITFSDAGSQKRLFGLNGSASLKDGIITLSVVNPHVEAPVEATIDLRAAPCRQVTATVLTHSDIHAHNTFAEPDIVQPQTTALNVSGRQWRYTFAPASVTVLRITL
jgi:alpha-N-arabinofuranosidase